MEASCCRRTPMARAPRPQYQLRLMQEEAMERRGVHLARPLPASLPHAFPGQVPQKGTGAPPLDFSQVFPQISSTSSPHLASEISSSSGPHLSWAFWPPDPQAKVPGWRCSPALRGAQALLPTPATLFCLHKPFLLQPATPTCGHTAPGQHLIPGCQLSPRGVSPGPPKPFVADSSNEAPTCYPLWGF